MELEAAKSIVTRRIRERSERLLEVSHEIWAHPELCFEEHFAHELLTGVLADEGFAVERGACGIDTAFIATAGRPDAAGPTVAVLCEYDALPGIGHGCGHNIIAAAGLGAALGALGVVDELNGRLVVMGTPAEEGGGGKVAMIDAGAFQGIDAALMVHPADTDLDAFWVIAIQELVVEFHGVAAHAAAAPDRGRNALDAAVLGYMNVAALRQHIAPSERIHGIFTHGGDKPNIVPDHASMQWYVRSGNRESLEALKERVVTALQAGAMAAGCEMTYDWPSYAYDGLRTNEALDGLYRANAQSLGRTVQSRDVAPEFMGSTDMGNVSQIVPSIHPMIKAAPDGTAIHTPAFAESANGPLGDAAVLDGAIAMGHTVVDLWGRPESMANAKEQFSER